MTTIWRSRFEPGSQLRFVATAVLLAAVIIAALLLINRPYFFHTFAYETGDQAANSLDVLRCEKFQDYLGAYSRWGFHHPGPFLFYWYAAGETIFWRHFHLTMTPLNAQVLSVLCLTAAFFALGVAIAARWVRSVFFVPLAALFGTLHYTAIRLDMCVFDTWPPYVAPLPFFCLLLAAASVGAGQGEDLPWLIFVGCVLIHIHVANPLFVLPLFVLAYGGLLWAGRAASDASDPSGGNPAAMPKPWRRYPRAHVVSGCLTVLFLLPIVIDLCHGADSNFLLILRHLRTHQGEHHRYIDAFYYLLSFGTYKPSVTGVKIFDGTTSAVIRHFLFAHPEMFVLWLAALLSPLLALAVRFELKPLPDLGAAERSERLDQQRWRFLGWLLGCFALCVPLALFWAHLQDGEMLYYNAWYIYSLYGILTIVAAIALSDLLERVVQRFHHPALLTATITVSCVFTAIGILVSPAQGGRNHAYLGDNDESRMQAQTVFAELARYPEAPRTKFLVIPGETALRTAPGVAILLKRRGYEFRVLPAWKFMLGFANALPDGWLQNDFSASNVPPMEKWRLVSSHPVPGLIAERPLFDNFQLQIGDLEVDPASKMAVVFAGPTRNSDAYALLGFPAGLPGDQVWTIGKEGALTFRAHPVPPGSDVEVAFDFCPPLIDGAIHPTQRLDVRYNAKALATLQVGASTPPDSLRVRIPAELWNAQPQGLLWLGFPDAIAPAELQSGGQGDTRVLGFSARKITFSVIPPAGL